MNEEFLLYIWQFQKINSPLHSTSGDSIEVISVGERNTNAGPDFFNARIKISNTTWAGNVEIHVNASEWEKHKHQNDKSYENVILHVVWNNDKKILKTNGSALPTLVLSNCISASAWNNYQNFMQSKLWIACENLIADIDGFRKNAWLQRLLIERLEEKSKITGEIFVAENKNWIQTFYRFLALNMGFKLNNQAFELLAQTLPFSYLAKHADNIFQVEAMIFGQAGMLETEFKDSYPLQLQKEYRFLKEKFNLSPIDAKIWKFMRIHPNNFPTVRLAQFAALVNNSTNLMQHIFDYKNAEKLKKRFKVNPSEYWNTHYIFSKTSGKRLKPLGESSIDLLMINFIAPLYVAYGKHAGDNSFVEKAIDLLLNTKGEKNSIIKHWKSLNFNVECAANTQALLQLKNAYCNKKQCLRCHIGNILLK